MKTAIVYGLHAGDYTYTYVGVTTKPLAERRREHVLRSYREPERKLYQWIAAHPWFKVEELEVIVGEESEMYLAEKRWIATLGTYTRGLNLTLGGRGCAGLVRTPEHSRKVSTALKGRPVSEETRAKISASKKGKRLPQEVYDRMAEARRGSKYSDQHKKNISDSLKGRVVPEDQKAKMREGHSKRYQCEECDFVSGPVWVARHHNKVGHVGRVLL